MLCICACSRAPRIQTNLGLVLYQKGIHDGCHKCAEVTRNHLSLRKETQQWYRPHPPPSHLHVQQNFICAHHPLSLWMRQGPHAIDAPSLSRRCCDNNRAVRTERQWWGHDTSRWVLSYNRDSVRLPALCMCMAGWGECVGAFVWGLREHITSSHTAARLTVNTCLNMGRPI